MNATPEPLSAPSVVPLALTELGVQSRSVSYTHLPRDGRFIEEVGYYNPVSDPVELKINEERAKYWLGTGAQPTDTVRGLLKKGGVL